ncbi:hypothetical protein [Microvirga lotononidis]|uniref:Uncharacterized protein n=1 Tax=Microvirga lotononidis TaxID=864069 RepID=I4YP59_9HYPH|nr:hypothetical protein [Microvirga lotononidis]EIM25751.1 hypothetical protein MicloDRAFT_00064780 [Microvirga lotononidis]WQO25680.1 hypothetical protein U0023_13230 [Microvirga lotononidis]
MIIPFKELEPDRGGLDTGLLTIAKNCYPNTIGWGPMPSLSTYGSNALPSGCVGMGFAKTKAGVFQVYAGTSTKLYRLSAGTWNDVSRLAGGNYNVLPGNQWQFAQYDSKFIAVNGSDANQIIDIESGAANFTAQGGSPPVARYVWTVGDFVFVADATNRRRFLNSGFNQPEFWTIGSQLCDEFLLPDGGNIAGPGTLGSFGFILQDGGKARRIIQVEGDPNIAWRVEEIAGIRSAVAGYSTIPANGQVYYMAEDGPYTLALDGSNRAIGSHRVAKEFLANCDTARLEQIQGFADPYSPRIYWAYYSSAAASSYDRLLGYDYELDRLFFVEVTAKYWQPVAVPGMTLEQLDANYPSIDGMDVSLDSRQFQGGRPTVAAVGSDGRLALLTGPAMQATLEVSPLQLNPNGRAIVTQADLKGVWGDAAPAIYVGKQEYSGDEVVWTGPFSRHPRTGVTHLRASSRLHTFRVVIPAQTSWKFAQGLATTEQPDGQQ